MGFDYAPPKYAQVVAEIKRRIEEATTRRARCCPPSTSSSQDFGVSRPTIVKSLSALRQDGLDRDPAGPGKLRPGPPGSGGRRTDPART